MKFKKNRAVVRPQLKVEKDKKVDLSKQYQQFTKNH